MIGCAVADSDLEIQRVNNDIFIWDEIQEDCKLQLRLKSGYDS